MAEQQMLEPGKRVIVALDVPGRAEALQLVQQLRGEVAMVKVGLEGFVGHGPDLVRAIRDLGVEVFLDLKLHDIPRTAAAAAAQAANLGVRLLTVHAGGGEAMVRAVCEAVAGRTQVVAVTVLTSFDAAQWASLGFAEGVEASALRLGRLALQAGAAGLVCSAHELSALRALGGSRVVPGVRPAGEQVSDQRRVATPREALQAGATWLVIGRPIVAAGNALQALQRINQDVQGVTGKSV